MVIKQGYLMTIQDPIVIVAAKRTPIGQFNGQFSQIPATDLGAQAIAAAVAQADIAPNQIDQVIMGCVLAAGLGQAPARQATISAGLPFTTGCTTINKMCGSGMQAVIYAYDILQADSADIVTAGGFENMTQSPYLLKKARNGYVLGNDYLYDHMMLDGLEDAYNKGQSMGLLAELCAEHFKITREQQDAYAIESAQRAQAATELGYFTSEITPITVKTRNEDVQYTQDEGIAAIKLDKIPQLKPAFKENGTITAANASSISDGAAALILMRTSTATHLQLKPLATLVGHASHAQDPAWFTTAPSESINKLIRRIGWKLDDIDLFEINEAFAVVTLACIQQLNIPPEKVNVHGGACVLGHPIGASGARIITTLLYALQRRGLTKGIASLCIGGGEATALAIELVK